ncbi:Pleckstrin homology domain-containing family A member 2 [Bagarius yarrelli]|uniref:Pleckstrin homology domain-containing family A member 2 n=1 Tax=Bagarius yarrelli TaxID=175774 RepID=A0A556UFP3_BAGYA|nr:Pleckstrin homology domain-containing family A member 2 [Bagarius yarrelli]
MPYLDRHNRICGFLDIEDNENSGKFYRRYFILDTPRNCLLWYMDNPQVSEVSVKQKPKTEFCFVINALSRRYFLQANDDMDLKEWVIALNKATKITVPKNPSPVTQTDTVPITSQTQPANRQAYKTAIVGGVVVQTPVQQNETDDVFTNEVSPHVTLRRCQSLRPNVLRSGYCVKQGNVVMPHVSPDLYGTNANEDKDPLRSIRLRDIQKVHECLVKSGDLLSRDNLFEIITNARTFYIQIFYRSGQIKPPLIKSCSTAQSWQPWTPIPKKATRSVNDEIRESAFSSLPSLADSQRSSDSISRQRHHSQPQQSATDPHFAMDKDTHMRTSDV